VTADVDAFITNYQNTLPPSDFVVYEWMNKRRETFKFSSSSDKIEVPMYCNLDIARKMHQKVMNVNHRNELRPLFDLQWSLYSIWKLCYRFNDPTVEIIFMDRMRNQRKFWNFQFGEVQRRRNTQIQSMVRWPGYFVHKSELYGWKYSLKICENKFNTIFYDFETYEAALEQRRVDKESKTTAVITTTKTTTTTVTKATQTTQASGLMGRLVNMRVQLKGAF